jgi:hypothetical protein
MAVHHNLGHTAIFQQGLKRPETKDFRGNLFKQALTLRACENDILFI